MAQIERELRRGRIAPRRLDLDAAQHDLLQPGRIVRPQLPRRHRIAPQPPAHAGHRFRFRRTGARRSKRKQQHTEREQVAARIVADAEQLFGRDVGRGAERHAEFFLHQIGQLIMMRQAVIEQHGFARRAEHDVARLDIEMDDVLAMQIVQRGGDFHADVGAPPHRAAAARRAADRATRPGFAPSRYRAARENRRRRRISAHGRRTGAA